MSSQWKAQVGKGYVMDDKFNSRIQVTCLTCLPLPVLPSPSSPSRLGGLFQLICIGGATISSRSAVPSAVRLFRSFSVKLIRHARFQDFSGLRHRPQSLARWPGAPVAGRLRLPI